MVRTEVLSEALRGGDVAKALLMRTGKRLDVADRALRDALKEAPSFIVESKERHGELCSSTEMLNTELDMLTESLEEITLRSQNVVKESRANSAKAALLDQLALALPPFVQVAEALQLSDSIETQSFLELQGTLQILQAAIIAAQASDRQLLLRAAEDLEEHAQETTAMMNARYMDLFQVKSNLVSVRFLKPDDTGDMSSVGKPAVGIASDILARAGLLPHAIKSIVADIMRNDVAGGFRAATFFFKAETDEGCTLEWNIGDGNDGELLEFDLDDVDGVSEEDLEVMDKALDIANAAARGIQLFDMFRDVVLGPQHAGALALALQPWFEEHVLPAAGVSMSARREFQSTGVSKELLRLRARVTTISSRIVERALQSRGSPDFKLTADQEALENTVGATCRADALVAAKRATTTFVDAEHDVSLIVPCPLSAQVYRPKNNRPPEYFPPCMVSQSAATVLAIFNSTRTDAIDSVNGGSPGIGAALDSASVEILRVYAQDVQVDYSDELRSSYRLKALYYDDCMMLAHGCRLSLNNLGHTTPTNSANLRALATALERAGLQWMKIIRSTAEGNLRSSLDNACRNGALGAYGTLTRLQRGTALMNAYSSLNQVIQVLAELIPTETAEQGAAALCELYLTRLCNEVLQLTEISAEGCEQIEKILVDAVKNSDTLMQNVARMVEIRAGAPGPEQVERLKIAKRRVAIYREILNSRMEELVTWYRQGKYEGFVTRRDMEQFLVAIFEDTPLRAGFIRDLDLSIEAEDDEWSNENW